MICTRLQCIEKSHQEFTVLPMLAWKRTLNEDDDVDEFLVRSFAAHAVKGHVCISFVLVFHEFCSF